MVSVSTPFSSVDTPALLLDMDRLEANIEEMARLAGDAGVRLRPHTKIHECADIVLMQLGSGAVGASTSKLAEAEAMADAGIDDIMVVHPFYGHLKMEALKNLLERPALKLSVVVDMFEQAEAISQVGDALRKPVSVLLKIDAGGRRFGCLPGEPAVVLARAIQELSGVHLVGILAHESATGERSAAGVDRMAFEVASVMAGTAKMLRRDGIFIEDVVLGASPTYRAVCKYAKEFPEITEVHPGAMAIGDVSYVNSFSNTFETCALTVLTTVISTPTSDRAIIDAGGKTFSPDPLLHLRDKPDYFVDGTPSYGHIRNRTDLRLGRLSAEVGTIYANRSDMSVQVGDRLEIVPNNAILVFSLHDEVYGVRNSQVERIFPVTGRGKGN